MGNFKIIGERIKSLRLEQNKTQRDICNAIHIEQVTLSQYETSKRIPKLEILISLAAYFNVSLDYLVGVVQEPMPSSPQLLQTFSKQEEKMINTFSKLNTDNQDIIIGEAKKLLKEQLHDEQSETISLKKA